MREHHCAELRVDPLDAPYEAFTAYLTRGKADGTPYAAAGVFAPRFQPGTDPTEADLSDKRSCVPRSLA